MARNMRCSATGKDIHFTAGAADRAAVAFSHKAGRPLFTYICQFCGKWHLTKRNSVVPISATQTAEKPL